MDDEIKDTENKNTEIEEVEVAQENPVDKASEDKKPDKPDDQNRGERFCYVCRRSESRVGKLFDLPGGMSICADCIQRTFDVVGKGTMGNMQTPPNVVISGSGSIDDMLKELEKLSPNMTGGRNIKINPAKKQAKDHQKKQDDKKPRRSCR